MKPVSIMHSITHYEHINHYNALYVVMLMVRVTVNPTFAYNYDYTAL